MQNLRKGFLGYLIEFGDINKRINESKNKEGRSLRTRRDSYSREQYNKDLRNMMITGGAIRQYELENSRSRQKYESSSTVFPNGRCMQRLLLQEED